MDVRRKEFGDYFFPFSELMKGDYFVFKNNSNDVFIKTGPGSYKDIKTETSHSLVGLEVHRTKVSLAPSCFMF